MELYFIRHGETVDNVAGLYAGVTDSALTNHGVDQTKRLGEHFVKNKVVFTHIFASPLSRAFKTAQAVQSAQLGASTSSQEPVEITKVQNLIEQDFGHYERKPFHARFDPKKTGREAHREQHKDDSGFIDVESKDSMNKRADVFLDEHLIPLFERDHSGTDRQIVVAIVSHGMLLSHLWRRLLLRIPQQSITVAPEVTASRGSIVLQHLGGWSNTGYLELALTKAGADSPDEVNYPPLSVSLPEPPATTSTNISPEGSRNLSDPLSGDVTCSSENLAGSTSANTTVPAEAKPANVDVETAVDPSTSAATAGSRMLTHWTTLIVAIDRKDHLTGLKRQRGGTGRSAYDEKQGKLERFFKRQRTG